MTGGGTDIKGATRPVDHLKPPGEPEEFFSPLDLLNDAGDLVSPAFWVSEVLEFAISCNPLEESRKYFAGDWEAYARVAGTWANLAAFCEALAADIESGNRLLGTDWQGEGADAAGARFTALCAKLRAIKGALENMRDEYGAAAHAISVASEAVGQFLGLIGDAAATAAIAWAAGAAMSWTGWGAGVGYGLAATEVLRICDLWAEATRTVNSLQLGIDAVYGVLVDVGAELAAVLEDFPSLPAPSAAPSAGSVGHV
ncbi:WXG100 family type VII secretion target [Streptomyces sp. UNOC14_S4]|uniref:WXG100 family type VII secretion target n=1 Tax=Streptomyces sp. UNOC14_S4 TaxID=2872340 RepID=UPI001E5EDB0E|nr:hypothetical protein [Streptomyces sp. UNOC14_S4]MCC3768454.1 hypothetical protein [Streptomyces sp. UNOC14_S4]